MKTERTIEFDIGYKVTQLVHFGQALRTVFHSSVRPGMLQALAVAVLALLVFAAPCAAVTTLLTESFENGGSVPTGWGIETVSGTNTISFGQSTQHPSGYVAYDGEYLVRFNSYDVASGVSRLKKTAAMSTIGYTNVVVDFAWLESALSPGANDWVEVEWSTDGSSWSSAGTFYRYNAVQGWKIKTCTLPAGASNQAAVYIAFKFTSAYGYDCYLDLVHVTADAATTTTTAVSSTTTTTGGAINTLSSESFENGGSVPAGWSIENFGGVNSITFVTATTHPSGFNAYDGSYLVRFNSSEVNGGISRLSKTSPISTIGYTGVTVDFAWLESSVLPGSEDLVEVQWCTDGSSWVNAGSFYRYNAVQGWKTNTCLLPPEACNKPAIYIALKFASKFGDDCYLDLAQVKGATTSADGWAQIDSGTTNNLIAVWASDTMDIFAVGGAGTIRHYDINTWVDMSLATKYDFRAIWGSSGDDVFISGMLGSAYTIQHYDGSSWSEIYAPSNAINGIWGSSGSDVFAVGASGMILHYNGSGVWEQQDSHTTQTLYSVWGASGSDVYAVGNIDVLLHYNGTAWSTMAGNTRDITTFGPSGMSVGNPKM